MATTSMRTVLCLTLKQRFWNRATLNSSRVLRHTCQLHTGSTLKQAHSDTTSQTHPPFPPPNAVEDIYDVVIVGGGVAGTALACSLASSPDFHSKKVALIEAFDLAPVKDWRPSEDIYSNRVVSLTPASVGLLKDIGAWKHLHEDRIKSYNDMQVWDALSDARVKFNTSMLEVGLQDQPIAWMIENVHLQNGILQSVKEHRSAGANVEILEKTKVEKIFYEPVDAEDPQQMDLSDWPAISLSNGRIIKARLLVGADGANSPVRSFAGINSLGWDYDTHAVVATLEMDKSRSNDTAWQRFLPTGPIAILPLKDGTSSMVWSTKPHLAAAIKTLPEEAFCDLVNAALRLSVADLKYFYKEIIENKESFSNIITEELEWRENASQKSKTQTESNITEAALPPRITGVQKNSRAGFPLRLRNAERYVADRIALVGDAAHTIHPLAGQGLNQGLLDIQKLSQVLVVGLCNGEDLGHIHLLSNYASNRYGRNVAMLSACDKIHRLFGTEFEPIVLARSFGFQAVNASESIKAEIMKYAMGLEKSA